MPLYLPQEVTTAGDNTFTGDNVFAGGFLGFGPATELTIASGAITATSSHHTVDTESNAATDDLDTINGGVEGQILILRTASSTRDVTVKHLENTIELAGSVDFTLDNARSSLTLIRRVDTAWVEISRTDYTP